MMNIFFLLFDVASREFLTSAECLRDVGLYRDDVNFKLSQL